MLTIAVVFQARVKPTRKTRTSPPPLLTVLLSTNAYVRLRSTGAYLASVKWSCPRWWRLWVGRGGRKICTLNNTRSQVREKTRTIRDPFKFMMRHATHKLEMEISEMEIFVCWRPNTFSFLAFFMEIRYKENTTVGPTL